MSTTEMRDGKHEVTFHLVPGLQYKHRLLAAFGIIAAGLVLQCVTMTLFPGILFLLAGNAFLLVKGFNNLLGGAFDASAQWTRATPEQVAELTAMNRRIEKWDRSFLDFTCSRGKILGLMIFIPSFFIFINTVQDAPALAIISGDILALFAPHWFSGLRTIKKFPDLETKLKCVNTLLGDFAVKQVLDPRSIEYFLLLKHAKAGKVPGDIKFKVAIPDQHPDFMGFFGQVVTNSVSGTLFSYFYCVLVAKAGFGLPSTIDTDASTANIITEKKISDDVEVLVIRQKTTNTSGYATDRDSTRTIFLKAFETARACAVKR
jgi:hypothetical protein